MNDSSRPRRAARRRGAGTRPRSEALESRTLLSVDFTQGANGDASNSPPLGDVTWINGILNPNNSEYFEGVSTLQRVFFDAIPSTGGNQHTLLFSHQAVKSTAHAYDFLTSWDQTLAATNQIAPGTLFDPHADGPDADTTIEAFEPGSASPGGFTAAVQALHTGGTIVNVPVPDNMDGPDAGTAEDPILDGASVNSRIAAYEAIFGNRTVRIYANAAISASSMTFQGYSGSGPLANYALNWTSSASRVVIEFGAHLAQGQDFTLPGVGYGAGKGAGSISGGPYHVQLFQLDGASLGSQDNQIQANAVSAPPSFTIDKTGDSLSKVGDPAQYTITINNNGAMPLYAQSITDTLKGAITASQFTETGGTNNDILDVGETWTYTYSLVVPAGAPDPLVNTVTAVFDTQAGLTGIELTHSDSHSVNLFQPSITIDKVANDTLAAVGDTITYTFTVTNTSSADSPALDLTSVVDTLLGNLTSSFPDTLAPGASASASVSRVVQAGDADPLPNTVTVISNPLGFPNVISASDSESVNLFQPSITIDKSGDALSKIGDDVTYVITVTNTSSADSPNLVGAVTDAMLGINQAINLAPGGSATISKVFTVPAGAPDPLVNTATVTATPVGSVNSVSASDGHTVNLFQPSITIDKSVDDNLAAVGDTVNYTIVVTNTSSADSPNLVGNVVDALLGINQAVNLASGASTTITKAYTITSGNPDPLNNTATVTVSPSGFPNVLTASDSESVNLFQPSITIDKSGDTLSKIGDSTDFVIVVTNTSSSDSPNLVGTVTDPMLGINQAINLAPGASTTINKAFVVPAGSPDPLVNTASVTATPVGSVNAVSATDGHSVNLFQPDFTITKVSLDADGLVLVGDTVTYEIKLTNTGSADSPPLNPISILDTKIGTLAASAFAESGTNNDQLDVGETWTGQFNYVVVAADLPSFTNVVTATFQVADVPSAGFNGRNQLTRSASETLQVQNPPRGSVLPTGVDCDHFIDVVLNKTATLDSLMGELSDGFNLSVGTGAGAKITNVSSPGAAFYFTTFTAPADANSDSSVVKIQQTSTGGSQYLMALTQVSVYQVSGAAPDAHCETVIANSAFTTVSDGISFNLPDSLEGVPLVCRIRIDPKSIVGKQAPANDLTNNFKTFVNGVFADEDPDGVLLNVPPYALSATFSATEIRLAQRQTLSGRTLTSRREALSLLA